VEPGIVNDAHTRAASGDDWMDDLLRSDARAGSDYIGDDGFTAKVMAALPAGRWSPAWRRPLIIAGWALVAIAALIAVPGIADSVVRGAAALVFGHRLGVADVGAAIAVLVIATWSGIVYAAGTD
jgi:hypothetical protein